MGNYYTWIFYIRKMEMVGGEWRGLSETVSSPLFYYINVNFHQLKERSRVETESIQIDRENSFFQLYNYSFYFYIFSICRRPKFYPFFPFLLRAKAQLKMASLIM